jgi:hypothetical protein
LLCTGCRHGCAKGTNSHEIGLFCSSQHAPTQDAPAKHLPALTMGFYTWTSPGLCSLAHEELSEGFVEAAMTRTGVAWYVDLCLSSLVGSLYVSTHRRLVHEGDWRWPETQPPWSILNFRRPGFLFDAVPAPSPPISMLGSRLRAVFSSSPALPGSLKDNPVNT